MAETHMTPRLGPKSAFLHIMKTGKLGAPSSDMPDFSSQEKRGEYWYYIRFVNGAVVIYAERFIYPGGKRLWWNAEDDGWNGPYE